MKTDRLRINQLSPTAYTWYLQYLEALDAKDISAYATFLADNCVMQTNNSPLVSDKAAIIERQNENHYVAKASLILSAIRKHNAIIVRVGFEKPPVEKTELLPMYKLL